MASDPRLHVRDGVVALLATALAGCGDPFALVSVEDPSHAAGAAVRLRLTATESNGRRDIELGGRSFPVTFTLVGDEPGERVLLVEALRADNVVLARAVGRVDLRDERAPAATIILAGVCQTDADCADGYACNGVERCGFGFCHGGAPLVFDDDNPCNVDGCAEPGLAEHTPNDAQNGQACTLSGGGAGVCSGGVCAQVAPVCGDGFVEGAESCDDGGAAPRDGCTSCVVDDGWACSGAPSRCERLEVHVRLSLPQGPHYALTCVGPMTFAFEDSSGAPAREVPSAVSVQSSVGLEIFAEETCGTAVSSVSASVGSFHVRGAAPLLGAVTVSGAGVGSATAELVFEAMDAAGLLLTTPGAVDERACAPVLLTLVDTLGNPVRTDGALTVALNDESNGDAHADARCLDTASIISTSLASGATARLLYFEGERQGRGKLSASAPGLTSASVEIYVQRDFADPTRWLWYAPLMVEADACTPIALTRLNVAVDNGPPTTASVAAGGGALYPDADCASAPVTSAYFDQDAATVPLFLRHSVAGVHQLLASGTLASASRAFVVRARPATKLMIVGPAAVRAGDTFDVELTARDPSGNRDVSSSAIASLSLGGPVEGVDTLILQRGRGVATLRANGTGDITVEVPDVSPALELPAILSIEVTP